LSGTTISFSNSVDIPASTVISLVSDGTNLVVGGMNGTYLYTKYNYLDETYLNVGVKNNLSSVVKAGGVFYVLYTDNTDGMIKIKEVALPLSFKHFEVPGQSEPAYINGQAGTVEIKVDGGTDLTNLVATYQTTSDVTGVSVASVAQASGVTANDFSDPVTYILTDGTDSKNWVVDISVGILDTVYATICEGDSISFGTGEYSLEGEYTETFTASDGNDSTVMLILTVIENSSGTITEEACGSYTAPDGTVYYDSGAKTAGIPNAAGCDSVITINLTINPIYNSQLPASDNLVAYYSFNGNANDLSGNQYDGVVNGASLVPDRFNNPDGAYSFDGADDYIDLGDWENGGAMTFNFWAKWEAWHNWSRLMDFGLGQENQNIYIGNQGTTNNLMFHIMEGTTTKHQFYCSGTLELNAWVMITCTVDETGLMKAYKNGELVGTFQGATPDLITRTRQYCGRSNWSADGYFMGVIDEVIIYDAVLTDEEIMELFQQSQYFIPPVYAAVCENDLPYEWNGNQYTESGEYVVPLTTIHGCDSIFTLQLEVLPSCQDTSDAYACENELPYTWQGMDLTETGIYSDTLTSVFGCDSILTLNFMVYPSFNVFDTASVPELDLPYEFGSEWLTGGGTYIDTFATMNGCDSIVTFTLVVDSTDNIPPEIVCVKTTLELDENGTAVLNVDEVYNYVYDAGGIKSVIAYETDFTCSDIGQQNVRVQATDNYGNSSYCTSIVTIVDNLPPVINSVDDITVTPEGDDCFTTINYPDIIADDNCGVKDLYLLEGFGPDGQFPVGTTMEIWVAEDASGNRDTMSFNVTVDGDVSAPGFDAIEDVEIMEDAGWTATGISNIADGSFCLDYQLDFVLAGFDDELITEYEVEYVTGDDTGILKLLPATDAYGESKAVLTVSIEETGREFSDTFNIRIIPVNDPPFIIQPFSSIEMKPGDSLSVSVNSGEGLVFGDVDDDILQLSLRMLNGETLPDWLAYRNDSLFAFPSAADTGCVELVFEITDLEGGIASSQFDICVGPYLGVGDLVSREIKVYPNPTSGKVYIDLSGFNGVVKDVSVVNIAGQEVVRRRVTDQIRQEVDLSHLTSGIYILKVTGDNIDKDFKIILKTE
jgi:hypothetical protein